MEQRAKMSNMKIQQHTHFRPKMITSGAPSAIKFETKRDWVARYKKMQTKRWWSNQVNTCCASTVVPKAKKVSSDIWWRNNHRSTHSYRLWLRGSGDRVTTGFVSGEDSKVCSTDSFLQKCMQQKIWIRTYCHKMKCVFEKSREKKEC